MDVSKQQKRKRGHDEPEPQQCNQDSDGMPPPEAMKHASSPEDPIKFSFTTVGIHGFMVHTLIAESRKTSKTIPPTPIKKKKPKQRDYNSGDYVLEFWVDGVIFRIIVSNGRMKACEDEQGNIWFMPGDGVMPIPQPDRPL